MVRPGIMKAGRKDTLAVRPASRQLARSAQRWWALGETQFLLGLVLTNQQEARAASAARAPLAALAATTP